MPSRRSGQYINRLFCAVRKGYSQLSSRRVRALFEKATERDQLPRAAHFNTVSKALFREVFALILHRLVRLSALPLESIETEFTVDSTGFRCSTFGPYCQERHGTKRQHNWLNAHICPGVRTNAQPF